MEQELRILILEDRREDAKLIERELRNGGLSFATKVVETEDGFVKGLDDLRPQLILADYKLPAFDGMAALSIAKGKSPDIPFIFVSGTIGEDLAIEALKQGATDYVLKDRLSRLVPVVRRALKEAELRAIQKQADQALRDSLKQKEAFIEEIRRLNRLYDVLSQVNQAVVRIPSRDELLSTVCRLVVERGEIDLAWIGRIDPETSRISPVTHFGSQSEMLSEAAFYAHDCPEGQGNPGRAIREGKPFVCNECDSGRCLYPSEQAPARFGFQSCGSFPLRFQGQVCGALSLCVTQPGFFREREISLLEEVAMDISFALDKIEADAQRERLSEQFQRQSKFLQTLIDAIPQPVFYKDAQLRYLGCNTAFVQFLGVKTDQIVGKTVCEVSPNTDLTDLSDRTDREALMSEKPIIYETKLQAADGILHDILVHKGIFRNPDGSVGGIIGAMEDITQRKEAEAALRNSEERSRLAMQGANDGLWDWNLKTNEVYYSPRWKSMLGFSDDELENHLDTWKRLVHPDDLDSTLALVNDLLEGRIDKFEVEVRMRHRDGHYVHILSRASLFQHEGDGFKRLVGTHVDISERKRSEDALRASEERYRAIVEDQTELISRFLPNHTLVFVNDPYCRFFGESKEELLGKDFWPHVPDHGRQRVNEFLASLSMQNPVGTIEHRVELPNGEVRWLQWTDRAIFNPESELIEYQSVGRDITERKQAEVALRESEKRLNLALASSRMGVWEWDLRTNAVFWSPECYRILEMESFNTKLESFTKTVHPEDVARVMAAASRAVAEKKQYVEEFRVVRASGEVLWVSNVGVAEYDEKGIPLRMVGIVQDITERKQAEEERSRVEAQLRQAQKMEALGTLAGGIAHDFNNILGIISGYTEMAQWDAVEGSSLLENLKVVVNATKRAGDLVKQILAFSRQNEQQRYPVQVGLIVKEAMKMLRASIPSTIEIKMDVASKAVVMADATQIHQVLMNLCTNAAHSMREKGGVLDVSLTDVQITEEAIQPHSGLQSGSHLKLTVMDTGHGIAPSVLNCIFDPFFTTKEKGIGTGLGLAVVHGIVKSLGGAIEVESDPGMGTTFQVFLPTVESAPIGDTVSTSPLPRGHERILVVDDEPALAMAMKQMIERLGYVVEYRTNGVEALEVFRHRSENQPFDLVISDITMPHMAGAELAMELLKLQPTLPILLCTGFSERIDAKKARSLGIQGFLMKPVVMKELAEMIRNVLDERKK